MKTQFPKHHEALLSLRKDPFYHRYFSILKPSELKIIDEFIQKNGHLQKSEFEFLIPRLFLDQPDRPRNWTTIQEILSAINTRVHGMEERGDAHTIIGKNHYGETDAAPIEGGCLYNESGYQIYKARGQDYWILKTPQKYLKRYPSFETAKTMAESDKSTKEA